MNDHVMRLAIGISTLVISVVDVAAARVGPAAPPSAPTHSGESRNLVPLVGTEGVPTVVAEKWLVVTEQPHGIEGLIFDGDGNLYLVVVGTGSVLKSAPPYKELTTVYGPSESRFSTVKIHKDGRLFLCDLGVQQGYQGDSTGRIISMRPDGSGMEVIVPAGSYTPDDMVFDDKGGFYFTDFKDYTDAINAANGAVYYASPDFRTITPVLKNLASPNGIALSRSGKTLWVTETFSQQLHRLALGADGITLSLYGHMIPYRFSGFGGPDSAAIDDDDNVYVACFGGGKVMVFNMLGNLIGQVLIPGREDGFMLSSTTVAIVPGTNDLLIGAGDFAGRGAWIFKAKSFGKSWDGAFQFQK
ncbi:MAG TPA: SMP-30/gluconolactonase/LRE family protein [Thermoanaerobaculales bacterium]|nr:SMP-30/gluconolactonase/LRE family protein [Thermoanaerobaculales bacterium]